MSEVIKVGMADLNICKALMLLQLWDWVRALD